MSEPVRILTGDVLDSLATMPDGSDGYPVGDLGGEPVEFSAPEVQGLAACNVLIGEGSVGNAANRPVLVRKVPVSDNFGPVFPPGSLEATKAKNKRGLLSLDSEERSQSADGRFGPKIGDLPHPQFPTRRRLASLSAKRTSECGMEKFDGWAVHHLDGDAGVISGGGPPLTAIGLGLLDSQVSLAVDDSSKV